MGNILTSIVRPLLSNVFTIALLIVIHTIYSFRVRNQKHTSLPTGIIVICLVRKLDGRLGNFGCEV